MAHPLELAEPNVIDEELIRSSISTVEEIAIGEDKKREMKTEAKEEIALKDASDAADKVSEYHSETTRDEDEATLAKGVEEKALKDVAREQVCAFVAHSKPEMC